MESTLRRVANIQHGERRALCAEASPLSFTILWENREHYAPHCHCSQEGKGALCASLSLFSGGKEGSMRLIVTVLSMEESTMRLIVLFSAWQGGMYTG